MAGKGLIGGILTSLGDSKEPDLRSKPLNPQAEGYYAQLFGDYGKVGKSSTADLDTFRTQFTALTPQLSALDQQHASLYGDLINKAKAYDPGSFQGQGDYLYGKLNDFTKQNLDYGRANMNRSLAFAGYGDRAPSAYSTILDSSRVAGNMAPLFAGITNTLPYLNQQNQNAYFQNQALFPGLMAGQTNALQATPYRALVPSQMERANLLANLDSLNKINAGDLSNKYFYIKPNALQRAGGAMTAAYEGIGDAMDTVSKAASTYSNVMGMGGMGGQQPQAQPQSGQGMDTQSMMNLIKQIQGSQNSGGNIGAQPNYGEPGFDMGAPQSASAYGYQYPQGGAYGNVGMGGYSQYNPDSLYSQFYANQSPYF